MRAKTNPPSAPTKMAGPTKVISCVLRNRVQVHAAVATAQSSRMPVLLTVPSSVMRDEASTRFPPYALCANSLKVFWPRAGLDVFIKAISHLPDAKQAWKLQCSAMPAAATILDAEVYQMTQDAAATFGLMSRFQDIGHPIRIQRDDSVGVNRSV